MVFALTSIAIPLFFWFLTYSDIQKTNFKTELFITYLGLAPAVPSTLLYWSLLLYPRATPLTYLILVFSLLGLGCISLIYLRPKILQNDCFTDLKQSLNLSSPTSRVLFVLFVLFALLCFKTPLLKERLAGHDILVYATEGKIYYQQRSLSAKYNGIDPVSGFNYFSQHSPLFPLFLTWENTLKLSPNNALSDRYFKTLTPLYSFLTLALVFLIASQFSLPLAFISLAFGVSAPLFISSSINFHIDTFRIFLVLVSALALHMAFWKQEWFQIIFLGTSLGLSAAAHSIGVLISVLLLCAYVFHSFKTPNTHHKHQKLITLVTLFLFFGGTHYFIDTLSGTGWIL